MPQKLKVIFMGTPDFSVSALRAIVGAGHDVVAVYSQPPRPKGRGQQVQNSPVHDTALQLNIPVFTPRNFKEAQDVAAFAAHGADIAVVVAYGLLLPKSILDAPRHGCLNIHASLLPRWRGAAPIHRAVLAGDDESGITIMQMDEGLDTGGMVAVRKTPITAETTSAQLHDSLSVMGAEMIVEVLDTLAREGKIISEPQPADGVIYAAKLGKEEGHIDWAQSAEEIARRVRAFTPWPGTWSILDGKRLKILSARVAAGSGGAGTLLDDGVVACGAGALQLAEVQPEGKKPMDIAAAINGGYLKPGAVLS